MCGKYFVGKQVDKVIVVKLVQKKLCGLKKNV